MVLTREYVDVPVGERAMRTFVAAPASSGTYPGVVFYTDIFQLTESSLRWAVRLAGYGFVVAVPEIYHRHRARGHRARASTTRARRAGRPTPRPRRPPTSTRTSRRRWTGSTSAARTSAPRATARAGTSRSAPRSTHACAATVCWYPTGLHDGKLGADKTDSLERAGDIAGEHPADLRHQGPAHAAAGARDDPRAGSSGGHALHLERVRGRARVRARHRPPLRPRGDRPRLRRDHDLPAPPPVILYDHPVSANCLKVRILLRQLGPRVRAGDDRPVQRRGAAAGAPRAQPRRARARARAGLGRADPGVGGDPAVPGRGHAFLPSDRFERARVHQWLFFEQNQVEAGLAVARFMRLTGQVPKKPEAFADRLRQGRNALRVAGSRPGRRRSSRASATRSPTSRCTATCTAPPTRTPIRASTRASRPGWIASRPRRGSRTTSSRSWWTDS